jgi:Domain of unknown function (DUF6378)
MTNINETLAEREKTYGDFKNVADISQRLKMIMRFGRNWHLMSDDKQESLDMIASKIARILSGDDNLHDSWHDIAGYATLVANEIKKSESAHE